MKILTGSVSENRRRFLCICAGLFCMVHWLGAQVEAKVYAGLNDLVGVSGEYLFPGNHSLELGVSYRPISRNLFFDWHNIDRKSNAMVNLVYKHFAKKQYEGFHYGLYMRYWQRNHFYNTDAENPIVINAITMGRPHNVRSSYQKYSLGTVIGWKYGSKVIVDINLGLGWAFKFTETYTMSDGSKIQSDVGEDAWLGNLPYLSGMATIGLGYRFGKAPERVQPKPL